MLLRALALSLSLSLLGCGNFFFAELEAPSTCLTFANQQMVAAPLESYGEASWDQTFPLPEDTAILGQVGLEARLINVIVSAGSGIKDFSFVENVDVTLHAPEGSALPPLTVLSHDLSAAEGAQSRVDLATDDGDVVPYLNEGSFSFTASMRGTLPTEPWSADFTVCVYTKTRANYLEAAQALSN